MIMQMEPSPRWGHCSAAVDGKMYMWGGRTKEFDKEKTLYSTLHIFDPFMESWETKTTGISYNCGYDCIIIKLEALTHASNSTSHLMLV